MKNDWLHNIAKCFIGGKTSDFKKKKIRMLRRLYSRLSYYVTFGKNSTQKFEECKLYRENRVIE